MIIKTKEDWWLVLEKNLEKIRCIFVRFLDPCRLEGLNELIKKRDHIQLFIRLQDAWILAPDHPSIHNIPGWSVLCDLNSEAWVFEDLNGEDEEHG